MNRIPVAGPWITEKEIAYVHEAVSTAWYEKANVFNQRFEEAFARYVGAKFAISLPSCTSAIHLALRALGVGPGDEVIVPDATWIATAAPITYVGATPVFADIDPRSWCLSPASFEQCVTPRSKAVIVVDLYGNVADFDAIRSIASRRGIAVIEDAAEAVGAEYKGRRAGNLGDVGVFSFHGSKTLTTGEGGMLVTDRRDLCDRVQVLRDHGRRPGDRHFYNVEVAYKYKMSSLQAALGLAQLERIDELLARKREIFGWYREGLGGVEGVALNCEPPQTTSTFWMVTAVPDSSWPLTKEMLMEALDRDGIDSRPFFHPLSSLPAYGNSGEASAARTRNVVSYRLGRSGINLPSALNLTREQIARVCRSFEAALKAHH